MSDHAIERLLRQADLYRLFPAGPICIEVDYSNGESLRFVEFASDGEPTSSALRRWHGRFSRDPDELPDHVRGFVDFLFERMMEQWDATNC